MKLLIHSRTPTAAPLKFGNGQMILYDRLCRTNGDKILQISVQFSFGTAIDTKAYTLYILFFLWEILDSIPYISFWII